MVSLNLGLCFSLCLYLLHRYSFGSCPTNFSGYVTFRAMARALRTLFPQFSPEIRCSLHISFSSTSLRFSKSWYKSSGKGSPPVIFSTAAYLKVVRRGPCRAAPEAARVDTKAMGVCDRGHYGSDARRTGFAPAAEAEAPAHAATDAHWRACGSRLWAHDGAAT